MKVAPRSSLRAVQNLLLSFGGEGSQSAFHFLLSIVLIRQMDLHDFGVFAVIFVLGGVSLSYGNALVSVPASVEMARTNRSRELDSLEVLFGTIALLISALIGSVAAVGLWLTLGHPAQALAGGLFIASWTLRNHVRTILFARREVGPATVSDVSYSVLGGISIAGILLVRPHDVGVFEVTCVLSMANAVAMAIAFWAARRRARIRFRRKLFQFYKGIGTEVGWSVLTATTWTLQSQAVTFLVAILAGPAAYAPIAAGALLFAPLRPAVWAIVNVFRPHFGSAFLEGRIEHIKRVAVCLLAAVVAACLALALLIWAGFGYINAYVFHDKFDEPAIQIIVGLSGLSVLLYLSYNVPLTIIQASGRFRTIAVATMLGALVCLTSVAALLMATTVEWSLVGVALGEGACGLYLWVRVRKLLNGRRQWVTEMPSQAVRPLAA